MVLINLFLFLLISVSASQLWSNSKICGYVRRKVVLHIPLVRDALLCSVCASFWVAIFVTLFFNPLAGVLPFIASNVAAAVINYAVCGILFKHNVLTED
jgi:hypothetical protein